ncbi:hypothetical protein PNK_0080 [Candidatus Protochlamydia naegleriophila]|uniref:Uncharacterized protein n=1 Tax=Candidatus Protochlamydia naegleriophila TaxID=389348 RepID=A0A0U5JD63_9BACT|nr:tetratricopeptide repeat protein [Candidatus Protochlamydia naegleriophila]CUI15718.1 hypothetical protein PNK_0080 [Candidatus Protochlamydia naegleriophila]
MRSWKQVVYGREHEKVTLYALKTLSHDFTLRAQQKRANPWYDFNYALYLDTHSLEALKGRAGIVAKANPTYVEDFNSILEVEPHSLFASNGRGLSYLISRNYEQALADFSQVLAIAPDSVSALRNQMFCYYHLNRLNEALNDLNRLLGLNLDSKEEAFLLAFRANIYLKHNLLDEASADLNRAQVLDTDLSKIFEYRGYLYCQQGRFEDAAEQLFLAILKEDFPLDSQHPIGENIARRARGDHDIHEKDPFTIPIYKKMRQQVTQRFGTDVHALAMNNYIDERIDFLRNVMSYPE